VLKKEKIGESSKKTDVRDTHPIDTIPQYRTQYFTLIDRPAGHRSQCTTAPHPLQVAAASRRCQLALTSRYVPNSWDDRTLSNESVSKVQDDEKMIGGIVRCQKSVVGACSELDAVVEERPAWWVGVAGRASPCISSAVVNANCTANQTPAVINPTWFRSGVSGDPHGRKYLQRISELC